MTIDTRLPARRSGKSKERGADDIVYDDTTIVLKRAIFPNKKEVGLGVGGWGGAAREKEEEE